jgi:copper(I)-binding protein
MDRQIDAGWIREAPPGATSLAAYATLKNTSRHPLQIALVNARGAEQAMLR